jgi:agmatine deiminase
MTTAPLTSIAAPGEWSRHARTWIGFPYPDVGFGAEVSLSLRYAQQAWAGVANALAAYEPVTVLVRPDCRDNARAMLAPEVELHETTLGNAWLRDRGPTFVHAGDGSVHAVTWELGERDRWDRPEGRAVATQVAAAAGVPSADSPLALGGGALQVDGEGTALVVESVVLDPRCNPGWTRTRVERELRERLGVSTVIWLPGELTLDEAARYDPERLDMVPTFDDPARLDMLAAFARPGVVLVHQQTNPAQPDYAASQEAFELLRESTDARGRRLTAIPLPAPRTTPPGCSYLNHYVANDVVLLGVFDDPADTLAAQILRRVYRDREVLMLDARGLYSAGGGIHCITQQQPEPPRTGSPAAPPRAPRRGPRHPEPGLPTPR